MTIAQHISAGINSRFTNESVKRTAEIEGFTDLSGNRNPGLGFQPSASRTESVAQPNPSDKSLGYFQVVRSRGRNARYFLGKPNPAVRHILNDVSCTNDDCCISDFN